MKMVSKVLRKAYLSLSLVMLAMLEAGEAPRRAERLGDRPRETCVEGIFGVYAGGASLTLSCGMVLAIVFVVVVLDDFHDDLLDSLPLTDPKRDLFIFLTIGEESFGKI